jgi:hypothetical protein
MADLQPPDRQPSPWPDSWPALVAWAVSADRSVWLKSILTIVAVDLLLLGIAHLAL